MLVDEVLERRIGTGPRDADEIDGSGEFLGSLLDRGGFTVAGASSGCPEPEHRRLPRERRRVERVASDERGTELQRARHVSSSGRFDDGVGGDGKRRVRCDGKRRVRCGGRGVVGGGAARSDGQPEGDQPRGDEGSGASRRRHDNDANRVRVPHTPMPQRFRRVSRPVSRPARGPRSAGARIACAR